MIKYRKARMMLLIANLIMVGVKFTDKYRPKSVNTYLFLSLNCENRKISIVAIMRSGIANPLSNGSGIVNPDQQQ